MRRISDILIAILIFLVIWPVIMLIAITIKLKLGSPIFFKQSRPGLDCITFDIIKFRTMVEAYDNDGALLSDDQRMTKIGKIIRSSSLDELPSIWNVLKGDMSIIGPRPLLNEYVALYSEKHLRRHLIKPGITGWAQVNGRNSISWNEKLDLDIWYLENKSFWLDLKILFLTFKKVLSQSGINQDGHVTMGKFKGYVDEE